MDKAFLYSNIYIAALLLLYCGKRFRNMNVAVHKNVLKPAGATS
jgi:hypothetical protein